VKKNRDVRILSRLLRLQSKDTYEEHFSPYIYIYTYIHTWCFALVHRSQAWCWSNFN